MARTLRRIDGEDGELVLREIVARLDDPSAEVREEAARALGRIGSREATEALAARLADPSSPIRIEAARALGGIGDEGRSPLSCDVWPWARLNSGQRAPRRWEA